MWNNNENADKGKGLHQRMEESANIVQVDENGILVPRKEPIPIDQMFSELTELENNYWENAQKTHKAKTRKLSAKKL